MDDILGTGHTKIDTHTKRLKNELTDLLSSAVFELRWVSNRRELLSDIPFEHLEKPHVFDDEDSLNYVKILASYGAVVYLRVVDSWSKVKLSVIMVKSRVALVKSKLTTLKLDLCAAVLLIGIKHCVLSSIENDVDIDEIVIRSLKLSIALLKDNGDTYLKKETLLTSLVEGVMRHSYIYIHYGDDQSGSRIKRNLGPETCIFLRRCPNAETLSRHESPDCGAKRGIARRRGGLRMRSNADTTNATKRRVAGLKRQA
ncbi:hypothetical protein EVAR_46462_1 [Eumeta japonica]|uniref:Uncharacterized protein n=1 Tax=Eumeta variegata TaxID=151549 RepID=A0A4C1XHH6_EUMVA|nr:hypothetical protein EVAR_46462_1 [Eumeta japonica]